MTRNGMRPIHPGEVLREEFLAPLKMTSHALAMALRVPSPRIHEIIRERRAVSADTALRLSRYFQTSPEFWLGLQVAYDLRKTENGTGAAIAREVQPRQQVA
ncbi:HigA family addiction module antitoxin [Acidithiobacillus concretivorus]|uniref:HigA family addiction module antidote protein n=1 Tax=Acidithiobacillus concretivorus TaxID=3063952 RepID=A0ABS5ZTF6_9PROT|nr:HigA family addiction module antitoxin [Acidithiobacillus concretivorus]MBU2739790.1 HigA family addiction module antidote protein [Acidithiobacillus concretivorus]